MADIRDNVSAVQHARNAGRKAATAGSESSDSSGSAKKLQSKSVSPSFALPRNLRPSSFFGKSKGSDDDLDGEEEDIASIEITRADRSKSIAASISGGATSIVRGGASLIGRSVRQVSFQKRERASTLTQTKTGEGGAGLALPAMFTNEDDFVRGTLEVRTGNGAVLSALAGNVTKFCVYSKVTAVFSLYDSEGDAMTGAGEPATFQVVSVFLRKEKKADSALGRTISFQRTKTLKPGGNSEVLVRSAAGELLERKHLPWPSLHHFIPIKPSIEPSIEPYTELPRPSAASSQVSWSSSRACATRRRCAGLMAWAARARSS